MRMFFLLFSILTFAAAARADECDNAMDQATMNACAEDAYRKADAELNAVYKQVQSRNKDDAEAGKLLVAAERAWVAFRDAECAFDAAPNAGGSIYPLVYFGCLQRLTKARTGQLIRYSQCEGGEVACAQPAR
ncbi:MAG: lysozyme inhibitor LprI family protein [Rhodomicrobium sp.]